MDGDDLVTIGQFARACRLSVSALRFYDDCGLLSPAHVDGTTGYRWYSPRQLATAGLIRDLRAAEMPLPRIREVLDAPADVATKLLAEHDQDLNRRLSEARDLLTAVAARLVSPPAEPPRKDGTMTTTCTVSTTEFLTAIGQVRTAAAPPGSSPKGIIEGVLLEVEGGTLRLVATDRYRLAIRDLVAISVDGADVSVIVPAAELEPLAEANRDGDTATLTIGDTNVVARIAGADTALTVTPGEFPAYRKLLPDHANHRIAVSRTALAGALEGFAEERPITLKATEGAVEVAAVGGTGTSVQAWVTGAPVTVGFNPRFLLEAVNGAVGPDVVIELVAPNNPAVIRSATDGTLTCLLMPVRLDHPDTPSNLDFAELDEKRPGTWPKRWMAPYGDGPALAVDDALRTPSGGRSASLTVVAGSETRTVAYQVISASPARHRTLRWRGVVRSRLTAGEGGLVVRALRGGERLELLDGHDGWSDKVTGTSEWTEVDVTVRVPDEALAVVLGFGADGEGSIWVGDLALNIDP